MEKYIKIYLPCDYKINSMMVEQISCLFGMELNESIKSKKINNHNELKLDMKRFYTEEKSDYYARAISNILLEYGIRDFEIDFSTDIDPSSILKEDTDFEHNEESPESVDVFDDLDYDVVNDLIVYMKNDNNFYHNFYYPTMHKISKIYKKTKKLEIQKYVKRMVTSAITQYCKSYDIREDPKNLFGSDEVNEIISKVKEEEGPQLQKGEYS